MTIKHFLIGLIAMLALSSGASAASGDHSAPAAQGYDVVSYQNAKRPVRGNGHYTAQYNGATYLFSSKANQKTFSSNPEKYAPAYNGFCAFGVSVGKKFIGDPEVWRLVDGKLYLNLDADIQQQWLKDVPGRIAKADKQWSKIK